MYWIGQTFAGPSSLLFFEVAVGYSVNVHLGHDFPRRVYAAELCGRNRKYTPNWFLFNGAWPDCAPNKSFCSRKDMSQGIKSINCTDWTDNIGHVRETAPETGTQYPVDQKSKCMLVQSRQHYKY